MDEFESNGGECYDYECDEPEDQFLDSEWEDRLNGGPYPEECYDDSMDGDAESALASAGHGTDEDYGYYGGGDE